MCMFKCIYIYIYIIYIHTYIHTYIHAYILTYITLHYITLHYITLHYITLHYITLHYIHTYIHVYIYIYVRPISQSKNATKNPGGARFSRDQRPHHTVRGARRWVPMVPGKSAVVVGKTWGNIAKYGKYIEKQ